MAKATLRTLMLSCCAPGLILAALALPANARAEDPEIDVGTDLAPPGFLELELGFSVPPDGTDGSVAFFGPKFRGRYAVTDDVLVGLEWGMALVHASLAGDSDTETRGGNPALSAALRFDMATSRLEVGGGVALPLARFGDEPLTTSFVLASALALDGLRDYWLWAPDTLSFFVPVHWEKTIIDVVRVSTDAALALHVPTSEEQRTHLGLQLATTLAYAHERSWVGLRVQLSSLFLNKDSADLTQLAFGPEGRLDLGLGYFHGRLVLNIDRPFGFAFETGGVWGMFLGAGVYL